MSQSSVAGQRPADGLKDSPEMTSDRANSESQPGADGDYDVETVERVYR